MDQGLTYEQLQKIRVIVMLLNMLQQGTSGEFAELTNQIFASYGSYVPNVGNSNGTATTWQNINTDVRTGKLNLDSKRAKFFLADLDRVQSELAIANAQMIAHLMSLAP